MNTSQVLAKVIKRAASIHEGSWNGEKYSKNRYSAAVEACKECGVETELAEIVNITLLSTWNDTLFWANGIEEN